jgi:hypothetical protein
VLRWFVVAAGFSAVSQETTPGTLTGRTQLMRKQITVTAENQEALSGFAGEALSLGTTVTLTAPRSQAGRPCSCGCGEATSGGFWVPGHDAKRKSFLFAEVRSGDTERAQAALSELADREWPVPNTKADRAQAAAREAAAAKQADTSDDTADAEEADSEVSAS